MTTKQTPDQRAAAMVDKIRAEAPNLAPLDVLRLSLAATYALADQFRELSDRLAALDNDRDDAKLAALDEQTAAERKAIAVAVARRYNAQLAKDYGVTRAEIDAAMQSSRSPRPGRSRS